MEEVTLEPIDVMSTPDDTGSGSIYSPSFDSMPNLGEPETGGSQEYDYDLTFGETYDLTMKHEATFDGMSAYTYGQPIFEEELEKFKKKNPDIDITGIDAQRLPKMYKMYKDGTLMNPQKQAAYGDKSDYAKYKAYFDNFEAYGLKSPEVIRAEANAKATKVYKETEQQLQKGSTMGSIAGSVSAYFHDLANFDTPLEMAANVVGGEFVAGKALLPQVGKSLAVEFAANAATQPNEQYRIYQRKKELGIEYTEKDAIKSAILNSTIGALFGTTVNGITYGAGRAFTRDIATDSPELASHTESLNADNVTDLDNHIQAMSAVEDGVDVIPATTREVASPNAQRMLDDELGRVRPKPEPEPTPQLDVEGTPEARPEGGSDLMNELNDFETGSASMESELRPDDNLVVKNQETGELDVAEEIKLRPEEEAVVRAREEEVKLEDMEARYGDELAEVENIRQMSRKDLRKEMPNGKKKTNEEVEAYRQKKMDEVLPNRKEIDDLRKKTEGRTKDDLLEETVDAKLKLLDEAGVILNRHKNVGKKSAETPIDPLREHKSTTESPEDIKATETEARHVEKSILDDELTEAVNMPKPTNEREAVEAVEKAKELIERASRKENEKAREDFTEALAPEKRQKVKETVDELSAIEKEGKSINDDIAITEREIADIEDMLKCLI